MMEMLLLQSLRVPIGTRKPLTHILRPLVNSAIKRATAKIWRIVLVRAVSGFATTRFRNSQRTHSKNDIDFRPGLTQPILDNEKAQGDDE